MPEDAPPPDGSSVPADLEQPAADRSLHRWFLHRVVQASWNVDFYRRPLREPWRDAAVYFLGLWLLLGLCLGGVEAYTAWSRTDQIGKDLQRQMPTVVFRNGDIEVEAAVPYHMTVLDRHRVILDPEASLNRQQLDRDVAVVIVDDYLYVRQGPDRFRAISTRVSGGDSEEPTVFDPGTVREMMFTVKAVIAGLTLLLYLLLEGLRLVVWLLVISGAGLLVVGIRYNLRWIEVLKLTCYAITPVGLLDVFLYTTDMIPMYAEVLYTALAVGWLMLAVHRLDERHLEESGESENPPTP